MTASVLITGYASGIGKQLAQDYLAQGFSLVLCDMSADDDFIHTLKNQATMQQKVSVFHVDICESVTLQQQLDYIMRSVGTLHLCVHCAGILVSKPFSQISNYEFQQIIDVNVIGTRNLVAAALPHLEKGGQIGLVASMAGINGVYGYSAYGASKFAVMGLGKALQLELKPLGIGVSLICPPSINTPMVQTEAESIHPATKALKDMAGTLSVEDACRQIRDGLKKRKALIIPGKRAKAIYYSERFLPSAALRRISDYLIHKFE